MPYAIKPALLALTLVGLATAPARAAEPAVTANNFIELFEQLGGNHPGHRKAHARGVCAQGSFTPSPDARFADAALLSSGELPVTLRFSVGGGNPQADERAPGTRGVGLQIGDAGGPVHVFTGNNFPVFAGKDPQTFFGLLKSRMPGPDGSVDPSRAEAYVRAHPSVQANVAWQQSAGIAASYANTRYYGLHTFFYQPEGAGKTMFRWELVPLAGTRQLSADEASEQAADFLGQRLRQQVEQGDAQFRLEAVIGQPGDSVNDPSQRWPEERERVVLGQVTLHSAGGEQCVPVNFDPNRLSAGFSPSDDPVLQMRSAAYAISFARRLSGS
ncbi:catalase [Seongchinamella sediminis]|uniref:Catalase-related peroxidase n=1 Tax=Seongchinamella sediminis TaxID=2283635 RepID=A0A3L7DYI2_9GAMM|nr:catalase family peroxidase [Seongchinamella sediminis]RLQ21719.1 catalase [Seongchinamella sediminis]